MTKPLASLVSAGMILLPIVASSAYGVANTYTDYQKSSNINNAASTTGELQAQAGANNCFYYDNLDLTANEFISKCCKGSIRQRFPGQFLTTTLEFIDTARAIDRDAKTAYKLLNDGRFRK
ncbi:hypothetical protein [Tolypothrix sp. NIES-4075]|uniref:hypothetical protein n=1 Tax=Tolypothrix sp. NIES-4075 TaxID=2005459 RepID=UPI0011801D24|nr:hypothetical protein [Tolypothrix sp. NIES-4075]